MIVKKNETGNILVFKKKGAQRTTAILTIEKFEWTLKFFGPVADNTRDMITSYCRRYVKKYVFGSA